MARSVSHRRCPVPLWDKPDVEAVFLFTAVTGRLSATHRMSMPVFGQMLQQVQIDCSGLMDDHSIPQMHVSGRISDIN